MQFLKSRVLEKKHRYRSEDCNTIQSILEHRRETGGRVTPGGALNHGANALVKCTRHTVKVVQGSGIEEADRKKTHQYASAMGLSHTYFTFLCKVVLSMRSEAKN